MAQDEKGKRILNKAEAKPPRLFESQLQGVIDVCLHSFEIFKDNRLEILGKATTEIGIRIAVTLSIFMTKLKRIRENIFGLISLGCQEMQLSYLHSTKILELIYLCEESRDFFEVKLIRDQDHLNEHEKSISTLQLLTSNTDLMVEYLNGMLLHVGGGQNREESLLQEQNFPTQTIKTGSTMATESLLCEETLEEEGSSHKSLEDRSPGKNIAVESLLCDETLSEEDFYIQNSPENRKPPVITVEMQANYGEGSLERAETFPTQTVKTGSTIATESRESEETPKEEGSSHKSLEDRSPGKNIAVESLLCTETLGKEDCVIQNDPENRKPLVIAEEMETDYGELDIANLEMVLLQDRKLIIFNVESTQFRGRVVTYIVNLGLCLDFNCSTIYQAVKYLNCFQVNVTIIEGELMILAAACLSLAAKIADTKHRVPQISKFVTWYYDSQALGLMELRVIGQISNNKTTFVTPFAFTRYFLSKFCQDDTIRRETRTRVAQIIMSIFPDTQLMSQMSSELAAAATLFALNQNLTLRDISQEINALPENEHVLPRRGSVFYCYSRLQALSNDMNEG